MPKAFREGACLPASFDPRLPLDIVLSEPSCHAASGTENVPGDDSSTRRRSSSGSRDRKAGPSGGGLSSAQVSEKLIGALSVDGRRFVIADEDGTFDGTVVDNDTLDYCYAHVTPDRPRRRRAVS